MHSLITHNDYLSRYDWNLSDFRQLTSSIENIKKISDNSDEFYQSYLNDLIYGLHTDNKIDQLMIKKLINQIIIDKYVFHDICCIISTDCKFSCVSILRAHDYS